MPLVPIGASWAPPLFRRGGGGGLVVLGTGVPAPSSPVGASWAPGGFRSIWHRCAAPDLLFQQRSNCSGGSLLVGSPGTASRWRSVAGETAGTVVMRLCKYVCTLQIQIDTPGIHIYLYNMMIHLHRARPPFPLVIIIIAVEVASLSACRSSKH